MIPAVVNVAAPIPISFYDATGAGATGLTITSSARKAGTATTIAATSVTDRSNGDYDVLITFPSTATWRLTSTTTIDGDPAIDITDVAVLAAAADPAALADAIAAVQTTVDGVAAMTDVATSTRASAAVWTSGRAARLDRIGADSVAVRSATAASALIELRQGADYTVSADTALEWDVTTATDLSPEGTIVTLTISSRSLQGDDAITATCTVTNPAADTKTITAELTDTDTARLRTSEFTRYQIDAQIGPDTVPLVEGRVKVLPALA